MATIRSSCFGNWTDGTACGRCDKCRATAHVAAARIAELVAEKAERDARTERLASAIIEAAACLVTRRSVADGWPSDADADSRAA